MKVNFTFGYPLQCSGINHVFLRKYALLQALVSIIFKHPDLSLNNDRAVVQLWWSGVAENGNPIDFAACFLITIEDNQITRIVDFYDQLSYNSQFE